MVREQLKGKADCVELKELRKPKKRVGSTALGEVAWLLRTLRAGSLLACRVRTFLSPYGSHR